MTIDKDKAVEAQKRLSDLISAGREDLTSDQIDSLLRQLLSADQLRELIEERYTLSSAVDMYKGKLEIVEAERDRYKADAERYQWLIDQRRWYYNKTPTPGISLKWENLIQGNSNWIGDAIDTQRGVK